MVDDCCKNVALFQKLGALGSATFDSKRMIFMGVSVVLTALSWILTIVAMAGSSVDNDTVKNCAWTVQDAHGVDIYYGTYRVVFDPTSATLPNQNYEDCSGDFCNDCEDAGVTANNCAVLTFIMLFFFIALSIARAMPAWDAIMFKSTFIIMSLVNVLIMIIGMGSWDDQCADSHITEGGKSAVSDLVLCVIHILTLCCIHFLYRGQPGTRSQLLRHHLLFFVVCHFDSLVHPCSC
jgi:hypothetical protein